MPGAASRALAAQVLVAVLRDAAHLNTALKQLRPQGLAARDAALVQELCYGSLRFQPRLEFWLARLLNQPLKSSDLDLHVLLLVGLYQLAAMRIPAHAAVKETAEACRSLGKPWAVKLANAVLRRFQREQPQLQAAADQDQAARYAHPRWLIERLQTDWPQHWQTLLEAGNQRPPLTLRVNRRALRRDTLLQTFSAAGIVARACTLSADGVILETATDVETLPGFAQGHFSVQDEAAQFAAELLDVQAGMRVLDACAAPGGKTGHILESCPDAGEVLALDSDTLRSERIRSNLERLGLQATLRVADATQADVWWDGRGFERILLDAPCSASGVIRRHPDIKARRRPADVSAAASLQSRLLAALWPLLAPGGKLLYVTCSLLAEENANQIDAFLATHDEARSIALPETWGVVAGPGRQILTGQSDMDGFYYACLSKY
ncbi:MAG TPA: 16S rRNA (cytosine(967)-C(5))-methyltransferase RsmB [Gammaproteobacteria bacterium]|nr:16S rRNA (cytosine(967)-C(5))-methyltransferase RsmB [Gammaproteobacteria bacterium]